MRLPQFDILKLPEIPLNGTFAKLSIFDPSLRTGSSTLHCVQDLRPFTAFRIFDLTVVSRATDVGRLWNVGKNKKDFSFLF